ncbi:MAG TPA: hypothetical protein VIH35_07210, partial [Kiritimatiellia bacterium]
FDTACLTATNIPRTNQTAGAISNPGFEFTAKGTYLSYVDSWTNLGFDGAVAGTYSRSGAQSLRIYFTETLAGQSWNATGGYRYSTTAYAFTPTGADRLSGHSNLQAVLVMEFYNATNGLLLSYASNPFLTNAAAGVWSNLTASGIAPNGTVRARTLIGIVGSVTGFSGSVYFDDISQSIVSTGGLTSCGLINNPGFDDGIPGNIDALQLSGDLPAWTWLGGTNGGFIQTSFFYDGAQALAITFPHQLAVQQFAAQTAMSYKVEGRIFNPASQKLQGTTYATFLLQFMIGTNAVATKESGRFLTNSPVDTWVYFAVTSRAPINATGLSGRVACFLQGDEFGDSNFAGAVYYDGLCVTATNIPYTTTTNGALENPGFEDSSCGTAITAIDNWTALGNAGIIDCSIARSGGNSLQIYFPENLVGQGWAATPGDKYASSGFVYSSSSAPLLGSNNALQALVIQEFLNATGGVLISYASNPYTVTNVENTWVSLYAIGVAPMGTVSGRTLVGLVGPTNNFANGVYFDDIGQSVIWTQAPVFSLLRNAGYDDGPPGNADALQLSGDLPNWTWLGGTNAGFVQRSFKSNEEQALAITFPNNLMAQLFPVSQGPNLLRNNGFEIGPANGGSPSNWTVYSEASQESWAAETGTNGMAFHGWVAGGFGGFFQDVSITSGLGGVYSFNVHGNAEPDFKSTSQETWIKIEFWKQGEGSPRFIASNSVYSALTSSPNTWLSFTLTATNNDPDINLVKPVVGFGNAQAPGGAMACRWDNASLTQGSGSGANTGMSYVLEGYIFNPLTERMTGTAYATYLLEFYNDGTDLVSVVDAGRFTTNNAVNTWTKFAVTNRSPW